MLCRSSASQEGRNTRATAIRAVLSVLLCALAASAAQAFISSTRSARSAERSPEIACIGDCDGNGTVTIDQLLLGVRLALGEAGLDECEAFDVNGDREVSVDEIVQAVHAALAGCPATPTPTDTPTPTATPTDTATATPPPQIEIFSPRHGSFSLATAVEVTGLVTNLPAGAVLSVNGATVDLTIDSTFSTTLPLDRDAIFNPIAAELNVPATGFKTRARIVVVAGDSLADGESATQSINLRMNDSGLDKLEAVLPSLVEIDLDALIAPGTVLINDYCVLDSPFGCIRRVDVSVRSASFQSLAVVFDAMPGFLAGDIVIDGVTVLLKIKGGIIDCNATVLADRAVIRGNYELRPALFDPARIDVNLLGEPAVNLTRLRLNFTSGVCDAPLIEDLIQLAIGNLGPRVSAALVEYLRDSDAAGPQDSPLAAGIQDALADFEIAAPISEALGIDLEAPFFVIAEDADGVTFGSDTRASVPAPVAPLPPGSYRIDESFPALGAYTPVGGVPYDLGFCLSTTALNQVLRSVLETGILNLDLTELDLGGTTTPITASTLALFIPEIASLDPDLPITIRIRPSLAPILTGQSGPAGELAELRVAQLIVELVSGIDRTLTFLRLGVDARAGFDLVSDDTTGELLFFITPLQQRDLKVAVLADSLGVNESRLQASVSVLLARVSGLLAGGLGNFALPELFGLHTHAIETATIDSFPCMFFTLEAPQPTAE